MAYGVDANGNPLTDTGQTAQPKCPSGQKYDAAQGACVPTSTTQPVPGGTQPDPNAPLPTPTPTPTPAPTQYQFGANYNPFTAPSGNNAAPPGYDLQKWMDPTNPSYSDPKYTAGHIIQMGGSIQDVAAAIPGSKVIGADKIQMPDGSVFDAIGDVGGANTPQWGQVSGPGGAAVSGSGTANPVGASGPTPSDFLTSATSGSLSGAFTPTTPAPAVTFPTYDPYKFTTPPTYDAGAGQTQNGALIQQLLSSGGSLSPDVVAKMKEQQKNSVLAMQDQAKQGILQDAAARGVSGGGGTAANLAGLQSATQGQISSGYANTDISAAETNFNDLLKASGLSDQYQQQLLNQYLQTQGLNAGVEQAQAGQNYAGYQSQTTAEQNKLQDWLATQGFGMGVQNQQFSQFLSEQGIQLSQAQLSEMARQFGISESDLMTKWMAGS